VFAMPLIEFILKAAKDGEKNLVFKFLIIVSDTLCSPSNKPDVEQDFLEHLLKIVYVFA
jgi:hypothetical protein